MPWADVITDQPGACMGSQAWSKCDVTRLHAKSEVKVKSNTSMYQAITNRNVFKASKYDIRLYTPMLLVYRNTGSTGVTAAPCLTTLTSP